MSLWELLRAADVGEVLICAEGYIFFKLSTGRWLRKGGVGARTYSSYDVAAFVDRQDNKVCALH